MNITQNLIAVVMLCTAGVTIFLVPFLKKKYGVEKINEAINTAKLLANIANTAVQAMEQLHPEHKVGPIKLEEALVYARKEMEKYGVTFNEDELKMAIEAAVYEINSSIYETEEVITPLPQISDSGIDPALYTNPTVIYDTATSDTASTTSTAITM